MFPVSAETTVSASEQAHLPRNMFSIPQAERCTARPRRRPPTEQTAEPRNTGSRQRVRTEGHRHTAGGAVGRDSGGCSRQASLHSDRQTISGLFFLSFFFFFLYFPNELAEAANRIHHLTQVAGSWLRDIG